MNFKIAALAVGIGLAFACTDDGKDLFDTSSGGDTSDTDVPADVDPFITAVVAECNGGGTAWTFEIETDNWMFDAEVSIFDTSFDPAWDEAHLLDPIEHSELNDGLGWDVWGGTYTDESSLAGFNSDVNSVFNCDNAAFLTYAFEAFGEDGTVDCVVIGHAPNEVIGGSWPDNGASSVNGTNIARFSSCQAL